MDAIGMIEELLAGFDSPADEMAQPERFASGLCGHGSRIENISRRKHKKPQGVVASKKHNFISI
jgi:hypothetical protein